MTSTITMPDLSTPFPGLRCFLSEEDYLFFGRHEQIEDLLRRLRTNRLVAVVGTSGSGKSSLVRAGLLPAVLGGGMAQAGSAWEIAVLRPSGSPLTHLARALCDAGLYDADAEDALFHLHATLSRSRNGLIEALRQSRAAAGSKLLLVVDQFCRSPGRKRPMPGVELQPEGYTSPRRRRKQEACWQEQSSS